MSGDVQTSKFHSVPLSINFICPYSSSNTKNCLSDIFIILSGYFLDGLGSNRDVFRKN